VTFVLNNMSVPSTSRLTVVRAAHPGLRFRAALAWQLERPHSALRDRLRRGGWKAAWDLLERAGDAPARTPGRRRREDLLAAHLEARLCASGVPDRVGVFLEESVGDESSPLLPPAAALAVLARRSGPLYLPSRALEVSLADPLPLVLFFPEEPR
jgi:hypothetical protein